MGCWVGLWRHGWFLLKLLKGETLNNLCYPIHILAFDNSRTLPFIELQWKATNDPPLGRVARLLRRRQLTIPTDLRRRFGTDDHTLLQLNTQ